MPASMIDLNGISGAIFATALGKPNHGKRFLMLVFVLGLVAACTSGSMKAGLGPDEDPLTELMVRADRDSVEVGAPVTLRAIGRRVSGDTVELAVEWQSSGGAVASPSGTRTVFSASVPGLYSIIASTNSVAPMQDSVAIAVVVSVAPIQGIAITPAAPVLVSRDTVRFGVVATRTDGSTLTPAVTYSATGGTITAGGLYTAGATAGSFRVIATQLGGVLADTADITILGSPSGGPHPNEPVGMTVLLNSSWDSLPPALPARDFSGWGFDYNTRPNASILADAGAPESPANVLRMTFRQGFGGGSSPVVLDNVLPVRSTIYVSMWERRSANWSDNGNAGTKRFYLNDADISAQSYTAKNSDFTEHVVLAGTHYDGAYVPVGQWVHFEFLFVCNTPGVADGSFDMWVNGTRWLHITNVRYVGAGHTKGFSWLQLSPTYGGGGNPVPQNQYIDIDQFYISGKN